MLGHWHEEGLIACRQDVAALLALHLEHNRQRAERLARLTHQISTAFYDAGVNHVLLKGMHTAFAYFPEPGARPMSDIDILIAPDAQSAAILAMRRAGLAFVKSHTLPDEQTWRWPDSPAEPQSLAFVHRNDPITIDCHSSLNRRYAFGSPVIPLDRALDVQRVMSSDVAPRAGVLPQPLLLLFLTVHASCGLENLSLLRLVELVYVIRADTRSGALRWDDFMSLASHCGALASAAAALLLCEQLVPGTVPDEVCAAVCREMPPKVKAIVERLTPAMAHRLARSSMRERFMWAPTRLAVMAQIAAELIPPSNSLATFAQIYRARFFRLLHGTLSR